MANELFVVLYVTLFYLPRALLLALDGKENCEKLFQNSFL
jgi:hypothetical protein